ncbi:hypothetical protein [Alicyclobacillus macrosporangiidus]|uniref:Uncharacterized protein n=1 Tax=Alicyclobacillus macrosporangiidus TaxID=392015 RepID=A0A1I7L1T3_9BACL|nr:hypothetical protein [Alicyclobacillus macrosporangiidus]SFV03719.1 hypothetical protein SAMN05421543_12323 [Alicyclobacillus macrosporangiidus]
MRYVIAISILIVFFVQVHLSVLNTGYQEQALQRVTYALENASHAASMQVTSASVSDGYPVFDQTQADAIFREVIASNMKLDANTLSPLAGSMFKQPLTVELEQFVDYSNTPSFPYHYSNPAYGIDVVLNGPSIVYVVKIPIPQVWTKNAAYDREWSTVAAYPDK